MVSSPKHSAPRRFVLVISYGLAALAMIYLSYSLPHLLPGDFVTAMYSSSDVSLTADQEAELRAYYTETPGFGHYLINLITLDWGYSYAFLTPVSTLFLIALPWTLLLLGAANIISMIIGFVTGVEASWQRDSWLEKGMVGGMTLIEGIPEISTGVILLMVFSLKLQWFPTAGAETAYAEISFWARLIDIFNHLLLPMTTLVVAYFPGNFLLTRNSMMMVIKSSFVTTARAKGLPAWRVRYAHAARNALLPLITRFGLRLAFMITGALVVETIFSYPGLGTLLFNAIRVRDLPLIQAIVLVSSLMVLTTILILEMVYRIIDPRIEHAY